MKISFEIAKKLFIIQIEAQYYLNIIFVEKFKRIDKNLIEAINLKIMPKKKRNY